VTIKVDPNGDAYTGFRTGTVDWLNPVGAGDEIWSTYYPRGQVISKRGNGIDYLRVMVTMKPLDSVLARKAISLAIDREQLARDLPGTASVPATSLTPPPFGSAFQEGVCGVCRFDPGEARRLAGLAGLTPGTVLNFGYTERSGHERWTAALKRQLEATLGLLVNYFPVPFTPPTKGAVGASGIFRGDWSASYPSPANILGPLLSTAAIGTTDPTQPATGDNSGRYSNPKVDRLLEQAKITKSDAERIDLYKQAERIAIGEDLALIPLWYRQETRLVNTDRFTNVRMDWHGNLNLWLVSLR
jgi:oligopeptide transport system substrate-binding protein